MNIKYIKVSVVTETIYVLPIEGDKDIEELLKETFEDFPIHQHHVAREFYKIRGTEKVLKYEICK